MKLTLKLHPKDGYPLAFEVEAKRVSHYINNVRHWFGVHIAHDSHQWVVTHWDSGLRVAAIDYITLAASPGTKIQELARREIDKLVTAKGAKQVHDALVKAEKAATANGMQALVGTVRSSPDFSAAAVAKRLA